MLGEGIVITVECQWRLLKDDRLLVTREDDGQQFGLPTPVEGAECVNARLAGRVLERVDLRECICDLTLCFSGGFALELLVCSSGYEAWRVGYPGGCIVASGRGGLLVHGAAPPQA